jgi:hypothetical protein
MTSQRKKTAPPTPKHPRSSSSSRKGLIATETTKKQSVKKRTVLDNRFHRTTPALSCKPLIHACGAPRHGGCRAYRGTATCDLVLTTSAAS